MGACGTVVAVIEPEVVPGPDPCAFEGTTVKVYEVFEVRPINVIDVEDVV